MRLCEREGAFDFAAYRALARDVTWEEALRINAALVVIGDERAAYSEWRAANKEKGATTPTPSALTLDDYRRELDEAREQLAAAQQMLVRHRRAVLANTNDGRLVDSDVDHFELVVTICKNRIESIETHLRTIAEEAAKQETAQGVNRG